jgi:hypothetical protein
MKKKNLRLKFVIPQLEQHQNTKRGKLGFNPAHQKIEEQIFTAAQVHPLLLRFQLGVF